LRELYESFVNALDAFFLLSLPPVVPENEGVDNWQTSDWMRRSPGLERLSSTEPGADEHFACPQARPSGSARRHGLDVQRGGTPLVRRSPEYDRPAALTAT
jgi:hypothetical protein